MQIKTSTKPKTKIKNETREQKAKRLIGFKCVTVRQRTPYWVRGLVTGDHGIYETTVDAEGFFTCECEWGRYNSQTRDMCSHAIALNAYIGGF